MKKAIQSLRNIAKVSSKIAQGIQERPENYTLEDIDEVKQGLQEVLLLSKKWLENKKT